jgi:hypothetical protein
VKGEKLPWEDAVTEPEVGVKRLKLGLKGTEVNKEPSEAGYVAIRYNCVGAASVLFFGEMSPKILGGGAELEFDPGAGELGSATFGSATLAGKFKVGGLTVK